MNAREYSRLQQWARPPKRREALAQLDFALVNRIAACLRGKLSRHTYCSCYKRWSEREWNLLRNFLPPLAPPYGPQSITLEQTEAAFANYPAGRNIIRELKQRAEDYTQRTGIPVEVVNNTSIIKIITTEAGGRCLRAALIALGYSKPSGLHLVPPHLLLTSDSISC